jgi:hypothetical protein
MAHNIMHTQRDNLFLDEYGELMPDLVDDDSSDEEDTVKTDTGKTDTVKTNKKRE